MKLFTLHTKKMWHALTAFLICALLMSACAQPQPIAQIPLIKTTPQSIEDENVATPLPGRPVYAPGTLVDYTAQSGDTLRVLAKHFNTTVEEILFANPLLPAELTTLQAGTEMKIPIYYKALWGSQFKIMPDALYVNGPAQSDFDAISYVNAQPGWLKNYTALVNDQMRSGGEVIDYVARTFSISPRLLLAIAEYQAGALSQPSLNAALREYPLGYVERYHKGFYLQLVWAANQLNNGYYGWRNGSLESITRSNDTLEVPDPWQNAASVGIQYYFSQVLSYEAYLAATHQDGLYRTYSALFGDPWAYTQAHIPGNLRQDDLVLPFASGRTWGFTGGPHAAWGEGEPFAAMDFAPPTSLGGCSPTAEFVVAVAPGLIVRTENAVALLDLDMDGDERTGWVIFYLHLAENDMVNPGTLVNTGDPIGHPSCNGGSATGTHVHIARKYNGEWMNADSAVPFMMEGWLPKNGAQAYLGSLSRFGHVVTASENSSGNSAITAGLK